MSRARTGRPYRFHAFEVSYFSAKVRPALRYKGLHVDERRADGRRIFALTGLGFIPVIETPEGEVWQDSSDIYRLLEDRHPDPPLFPTTPVQRVVAELFDFYADEVGLIPAMHYRWGSELGEATARARFQAMIGDEARGTEAARRMAKARHAVGATPAAGPEIEAHTEELLAALCAHFAHHPFLLGARASIADCALMGPIDGHLFNDLVSRRLLLEQARPVVGWIERNRMPNEDEQGSWLADDALAPTLLDVLRVMGRDGVPQFLDVIDALEEWADARPSDASAPPPSLAPISTRWRNAKIEKRPLGYALRTLTRLHDTLRTLSPGEREAVDRALAGTGFEPLLARTPRHPVRKDGFTLVFAGA